jgi:hypothetical protein
MNRFLALFFCVVLTHSALGCSCVLPEPTKREDVLHAADVVFVGRAVSITCVVEGDEVKALRYEFVVERSWSGPMTRRQSVRTELSTCGFMFEAGKSYLISANGAAELAVSRCSYSGDADSCQMYLALLGKPRFVNFWAWLARRRFSSVVPACLGRGPTFPARGSCR